VTPTPAVTDVPAVTGRVAFSAADGSVFTARHDGSGRVRVSPDPHEFAATEFTPRYVWPVWSPDGRYLLFTAFVPELSGQQGTSLLKAPAATGGTPSLLYTDVSGTNGIGGVAHYAAWRPDGAFIATIANVGEELATFLLDSEEGFTGQGVSGGSPVYLTWSQDSRSLLVHTDGLLVLHEFDESGARVSRTPVGAGSISYRTPQFSSVSDEYLFVDGVDGVWSLYVDTPGEESAPQLVAGTELNAAFLWSPDGQRIALAQGSYFGGYERLEVMARDGGSAVAADVHGTILAFWWSPDGEKLLVALEGESGLLEEFELAVVDTATGTATRLGEVRASDETLFMIEYFDQYAVTHRVWSADSRHVVFGGALLGELADAAVVAPGAGPPHVWVIDTEGAAAPVSLGEGSFGTWSPQ
jgi:TolB protein